MEQVIIIHLSIRLTFVDLMAIHLMWVYNSNKTSAKQAIFANSSRANRFNNILASTNLSSV